MNKRRRFKAKRRRRLARLYRSITPIWVTQEVLRAADNYLTFDVLKTTMRYVYDECTKGVYDDEYWLE